MRYPSTNKDEEFFGHLTCGSLNGGAVLGVDPCPEPDRDADGSGVATDDGGDPLDVEVVDGGHGRAIRTHASKLNARTSAVTMIHVDDRRA